MERQLGIFWLLGGRVVAFTAPFDEIKPLGGVRDSDLAHADKWAEVVTRQPRLRGREYWTIERGRVLYRAAEDIFVVLASTTVARDQKLLNKIIRRFRLPAARVRAESDLHYNPPTDELFDD